jgi:hypothetical protein
MGAYSSLPRPFRKHVQYIVLVRPSGESGMLPPAVVPAGQCLQLSLLLAFACEFFNGNC